MDGPGRVSSWGLYKCGWFWKEWSLGLVVLVINGWFCLFRGTSRAVYLDEGWVRGYGRAVLGWRWWVSGVSNTIGTIGCFVVSFYASLCTLASGG